MRYLIVIAFYNRYIHSFFTHILNTKRWTLILIKKEKYHIYKQVLISNASQVKKRFLTITIVIYLYRLLLSDLDFTLHLGNLTLRQFRISHSYPVLVSFVLTEADGTSFHNNLHLVVSVAIDINPFYGLEMNKQNFLIMKKSATQAIFGSVSSAALCRLFYSILLNFISFNFYMLFFFNFVLFYLVSRMRLCSAPLSTHLSLCLRLCPCAASKFFGDCAASCCNVCASAAATSASSDVALLIVAFSVSGCRRRRWLWRRCTPMANRKPKKWRKYVCVCVCVSVKKVVLKKEQTQGTHTHNAREFSDSIGQHSHTQTHQHTHTHTAGQQQNINTFNCIFSELSWAF